MRAKISLEGKQVRAECKKCGRFLSEIHGSTNVILKCSSCKRDNSINIIYNEEQTAGLTHMV